MYKSYASDPNLVSYPFVEGNLYELRQKQVGKSPYPWNLSRFKWRFLNGDYFSETPSGTVKIADAEYPLPPRSGRMIKEERDALYDPLNISSGVWETAKTTPIWRKRQDEWEIESDTSFENYHKLFHTPFMVSSIVPNLWFQQSWGQKRGFACQALVKEQLMWILGIGVEKSIHEFWNREFRLASELRLDE